MIGWIRLVFVLACAAAVTLALTPLQVFAMKTGWIDANRFRSIWHRVNCWALGFRIREIGTLSGARPLLIVANHVSWTDIEVMASRHDITFIAKAELATWPVIGRLSRLQRPVLVEREARRKTGEQAGEIAARLGEGAAIVLFAEGTTSDGNTILPFKTSLFGAATLAVAEGGLDHVTVQPVTIAYTRMHGLPMGRRLRPFAAWIGDTQLLPHLVDVLRIGAIDVELRYGEPILFGRTSNRKTVAREVERQVRAMMESAIREPEG